jgi:uncharacterized protein YggE
MKSPLSSVKNITPLEALLGAGALFLVVLTVCAVTLLVMQLAKPTSGYEGRTITVTATGDAYQTPDIAEFTYTVRKEGKDVATTQAEATEQSNTTIDSLKALGVASADIQTQTISATPRYEWQTKAVACPVGSYCPLEGKNVLVGYESLITTSVRVRDFDLAGKILAALGEANVSDIQGPNFTTEDPDKAQSEARDEALARAREKAKSMSRAMGVRLGKVVSFNEGGGYAPAYGRTEEMSVSYDAVAVKSAPVPDIQVGQDKVSVTVNVTYRIN